MTWVGIDPGAGGNDNIIASHSLNTRAMRSHQALYRAIMFDESGLARAEREAIGVCVSALNDCHY